MCFPTVTQPGRTLWSLPNSSTRRLWGVCVCVCVWWRSRQAGALHPTAGCSPGLLRSPYQAPHPSNPPQPPTAETLLPAPNPQNPSPPTPQPPTKPKPTPPAPALPEALYDAVQLLRLLGAPQRRLLPRHHVHVDVGVQQVVVLGALGVATNADEAVLLGGWGGGGLGFGGFGFGGEGWGREGWGFGGRLGYVGGRVCGGKGLGRGGCRGLVGGLRLGLEFGVGTHRGAAHARCCSRGCGGSACAAPWCAPGYCRASGTAPTDICAPYPGSS